MAKEGVAWTSRIKIEKYKDDDSYKNKKPYEVVNVKGNTALTLGLTEIWRLVVGDEDAKPLNPENAYLGVGNSATSASASQDKLLGLSTEYAPMDNDMEEYPMVSGNSLILRSKFGPYQGNFVWNEWGVANADLNETDGILFNRKVEPMGSKPEGATWVIVAELVLLPTT